MNISTTLPPDVLATLAPAVEAIRTEVVTDTAERVYDKVRRSATAMIRSQGSSYKPGAVKIMTLAFPDRAQAFSDELYGRTLPLPSPITLAPDDEDLEDEDEDQECDEHCGTCGCCSECDSRHDIDYPDTVTGPNGDERCSDCEHWCNDR